MRQCQPRYGCDSSGRGGRSRRGRLARDIELGQHVGVRYVLLQPAFIRRITVGVIGIDLASRNGGEQRLVEELHAQIPAHLHLARGLVGLVRLDELGDRLPEQSLRAGMIHYNTESEVDRLLGELASFD